MQSRREFIRLAGSIAAFSAVPASVRAIEPITRPGPPNLKLALAAYSLRNEFKGKDGQPAPLNMHSFVDYAATLDLDGVELTSYFFPSDITPDYLADLNRHCHITGLDVSGGAIRNNFTLPPGDELERWFKHVETWCDHYAALGAPVIRVFAGVPPKGVSEAEAIRRAVPNFERACEIAGRRGIMLALENHDFLTNVDRMMEIVKAVKSPWFGVNFDSGNFHSENPYADLARIAPYAVNVQLKIEMRPTGRDREPTDFSRINEILRDANYSGYVVLEYEAGDPYKGIPVYLDKIRNAIG